jgi:drug/metabolite transporter (DMT)-like permease
MNTRGDDDRADSTSIRHSLKPTSPRATVQAYLLLSLAALAWGGNVVASRFAIGAVSPMALTCLRWAVVVVIFLGFGPQRIAAEWPALRPHWRFAIVMGAGGYTVFSAMLFVAAYFPPAVNLAILQGALPAMVLVGALLAHGTRATPTQIVGVVVTLVGVLVVATKGDTGALAALRFNVGDLMMLLGCATYAAYTLGLRRRPAGVAPMSLFFMMAAGACLSSLPLLAVEIALGKVQWPTLQGWAVVLFVGLCPSLIAQRAFMRGVELIGPGRAGLFVNLVPVFGAFLSVAMLGEHFAPYHALALFLVLAGILLAERNAFNRASPSKQAERV